ncbi:MAG: hypothetical protein HYX52_07890 [Chloroflexi bacterium]|nr:hypothetical protein [Chloroflexota bacterium]
MTESPRGGPSNVRKDADTLLADLLDGLAAAEASTVLAAVAHGAAVRLHKVARAEATARKGQPDWPVWAQLQNASRSLLLQASTCRDFSQKLPEAQN